MIDNVKSTFNLHFWLSGKKVFEPKSVQKLCSCNMIDKQFKLTILYPNFIQLISNWT